MIQIQNFTKRYGDRDVVKNISFTAKDGVIRPTSGTITVNGYDVVKDALQAKYQFGYVSDSPDHFLRLTGVEYLHFIVDIYDTPADGRAEFKMKEGPGLVKCHRSFLGPFFARRKSVRSCS